MSAKKNEITLQVAKKLINRLPAEIDNELKILILRAEEGQDTTIAIIDLLSPHENIRRWMRERISLLSGTKSATRGYSPVPGGPGSVPASKKWVCPKKDCNETLPVIQEDEDAPTCDVHGFAMIRGHKKKG
jgi:hypothetical protein